LARDRRKAFRLAKAKSLLDYVAENHDGLKTVKMIDLTDVG